MARVPYLDVAGAQIYHEVHGTGDPVLLLHGGFCSIETMRPQIADLAVRYAVYAPERPGHGRTADHGEPFGYERMAEETVAYLDAAELERVDLVGFSDGANIGILLARDHPDRVRSLTAISGNLSASDSAFVSRDEAASAFGESAVAALFADYDRLSPDGPEHRQVVWGRIQAMWADQRDIPEQSLSSIGCPTMVMVADHDVIAIPHAVAIRDAIPGARLCVIPGATHMLLLERPEIVDAVVGGFLAERS